MALSTKTASPYQLFKKDEHQLTLFLRRCRGCANGVVTMECPIIRILADSIVNNTLRWDEKWIEFEKGGPICTQYKAKEKKA